MTVVLETINLTKRFSGIVLLAKEEGKLAALEHDPEKWKPVFGKDHATNKESRP